MQFWCSPTGTNNRFYGQHHLRPACFARESPGKFVEPNTPVDHWISVLWFTISCRWVICSDGFVATPFPPLPANPSPPKNTPCLWCAAGAWRELKLHFTMTPSLILPDPSFQIVLEVNNASHSHPRRTRSLTPALYSPKHWNCGRMETMVQGGVQWPLRPGIYPHSQASVPQTGRVGCDFSTDSNSQHPLHSLLESKVDVPAKQRQSENILVS